MDRISRFDCSIKKIRLSIILATLVFLSLSFSACSANTTNPTTESSSGSQDGQLIKIKIGVSPVPHGDIIKYIQENLAAKAGLDIEIVEFTDYVQPNLVLADGTIDANFFQHVPYLEDFNKEHNLNLVSVAAVHIEPLGIYSKSIKSLDEISDGAVVGIPNDATNAGRALHLLAVNNLISLNERAGFNATMNDVVSNPKNLKITELEAAQLVRSLDDTTISVINGNYAIEGGFNPSQDALALESGEDNPYANILAVNSGHENDAGIKILVRLLTSPEVKSFLIEKYSGSVIPAF